MNPLLAELAAREAMKRDVQPFVYRYFAHLNLIPCWFHRLLADALIQFVDDVENRRSPRLIIEAPPRHTKSVFTTRGFVPWVLAKHPTWDLIVANSTQRLADYFGRDIQRVTGDPEYHAAFPDAIPSKEANAVNYAMNASRGQYMLIGAGGKLPGFGGKILVADDIVAGREMAESETQMEALWDWFNGDFMNRVAPGGGVIIMATRWAPKDITGRVLEADKKGKWKRLSFPALAEHDEPHRKAGEALQPEWYTKEMLEEERDRLIASGKERDWISLYQQRPANASGNFFKSQHFIWRDVERIPAPDAEDTHWYLGVDFAASVKKTADCRSLVPIGVNNDGFYYFGPDPLNGRYSPNEFVELILDKVEKYRPLKLLCEKGPLDAVYGPLLRDAMQRRKVYVTIEAVNKGEKWIVAAPMQARMESSKVIFPDNQTYRLIVAPQFLNFTPGADGEDDIVDAAAKVFSALDKLRAPAPKPQAQKPDPVKEDKEHWAQIDKYARGATSEHAPRRLNGAKY